MHLKQQLQQQQQRPAVSQVPVKPQHAAKNMTKWMPQVSEVSHIFSTAMYNFPQISALFLLNWRQTIRCMNATATPFQQLQRVQCT